jgi:hypothetical protein
MVGDVRRFRLRGSGGLTHGLATAANGGFSNDPDHVARYGDHGFCVNGARRSL